MDEEPNGANAVHQDEESDEVDPMEYYSDGPPDDNDDTPQGIPPTPPRPREDAGAFCVRLDHDEDLDITEYFTESEDEVMDDSEWLEKYTQFSTESEFFYSDNKAESDGEGHDEITCLSIIEDNDTDMTIDITSESAYEGDTSTQAINASLLFDTKQTRKMKRNNLTPVLRRSYYGRKRLMTGKRHFVSSVIEYTVGATLGSSCRKIPFYSLSVSPEKPTKKNKLPDPIQADVICDTSASISLAPLSITQRLKMRIDKSHMISVRGADGQ